MRRLVLIRHSQPRIEPGVGSRHWRLSPEGSARCADLAEALLSYPADRIFSSREPKAQETAEIVAERLGLPHESAADLHEQERRGVELLGSEEEYRQRVAELFRKPTEQVFGSESAEQAGGRFAAAIETLLARSFAGDLMVVAHGTVISLFAGARAGEEPLEIWRRLGLPSFVVLSLPDYRLLQVVERIGVD